ncbi:hypothetical protein LCGC14_3045420, partial [marine sediment metagenome]
MRIPLAQYGVREIVLATVVLGALTAVGARLFWPSAILPAALWLFVLAFFRDPQRRGESADGFLSPADGKVVAVAPIAPDGPLEAPGTRISVFMDVLSVHVNRSPCPGRVESIRHHDGGFVDARRPEASQHNESATTILIVERGGRSFRVGIRQVAGLIARRIVTDLRVGQDVQRGGRIGMIKFGS